MALASKPTVPAVLDRLRPVVASALSFTTVTAMEIPTPVSSDSTSPLAVVVTWSFSVAVALKLPVRLSPAPVPTVASVSLLVIAIDTTGTTAVEPLAPLFASVVMSASEVADSVAEPSVPDSTAPFAIVARVVPCS